MAQIQLLYDDGIVPKFGNGVLDLRSVAGPIPIPPDPNPIPPNPIPIPPGAIDISNQVGQKQYLFQGDFHLVAYNLKKGTGPNDHLGTVKVAAQIGGDIVPGNFKMTGSDHDEYLASEGNVAVTARFTVGASVGYPDFPEGGRMDIIGTNVGQPVIVDVRMVNY